MVLRQACETLRTALGLNGALPRIMRAPKVLFCDDDPIILRSLERLARSYGLEPVTLPHAAEAVAVARREQPDLIVLDLRQQMDGRDVLTALKKDAATRSCRVMMLTGWDDPYTRKTCLELGADDYQLKPFDPLLLRRIARMAQEAAHPT